jgi:hypothetical protein
VAGPALRKRPLPNKLNGMKMLILEGYGVEPFRRV